MIGIGVLIFLVIWAGLSLLIALFISKRLLRRFTTNIETGRATNKGVLFILMLSVLVFFAPILDQLIAYPKWQQLCATTGDFEWGPGMDKKKAFGRGVVTSSEIYKASIFPGIKVSYFDWNIYDATSKQLIFKKPHYSYSARAFFHLPSASGDKKALFLPTCENHRFLQRGDYIIENLNLTVINN